MIPNGAGFRHPRFLSSYDAPHRQVRALERAAEVFSLMNEREIARLHNIGNNRIYQAW
jgi:hypothetical protein